MKINFLFIFLFLLFHVYISLVPHVPTYLIKKTGLLVSNNIEEGKMKDYI